MGPEDRRRRTAPSSYDDHATFHPTFLYEFVYDLVGVGILLLLDRRYRFRPPALFALYVAYYTASGASFEELLRIDPSHHFAGLRINAWVSIVVFASRRAFFVWWQFLRRTRRASRSRAGARAAPDDAEGRRPMAIPKGRVRPPASVRPRGRAASSSSTSTRSKARSTCC